MRQLKITKSITNRESQSLEKYLQEIGKVDLLTPEEEVDMAQKIKEGDQEALDKLIKYNQEDIVNLKTIIELTYPRMVENALKT